MVCGQASAQGRFKIGLRDPECLLGVDGIGDCLRLFAGVGQQFEHADQHAVVAQLIFVGDFFTQGDHLVAVAAGDVVGAAVVAVALARFAAGIHRRLRHPGRRLHVDRLGPRHPGRAPVEQRQFERDGVAGSAARAVAVAQVTEIEHIDEAGAARQAERLGGAACLDGGGADIEPLAHGDCLDLAQLHRRRRQVGQAFRQPVSGSGGARQAHQPGQRLARRHSALCSAPCPGRRFGAKQLFARQVELADIADLRHPRRQFGRRFRRGAHLPRIDARLRRGHRFVVGPAGRGGVPQHLVGHLQPGLFVAALLDAPRQWRHQHAGQVERERALDANLAAADGALEVKARVVQAARLHQLRLGNADAPVGRLQAAVIEQGDLHGVVGLQGVLQAAVDQRRQGSVVAIAVQQAHVLADTLAGQPRHRRHAALGRHRRATAQQRRRQYNELFHECSTRMLRKDDVAPPSHIARHAARCVSGRRVR